MKIIITLLLGVALMTHSNASEVNLHTLRLKPGQDLKKELTDYIIENKLEAISISTCVGSLKKVNIRYANKKEGTELKGHFEIVSLTGTMAATDGSHLHISISDENGKTIGGHLLDGSEIYTTAEVVLAEHRATIFKRELDPTYGYKELIVKKKDLKK